MFLLVLLMSLFSGESLASGGAICDSIFRSPNVGCDDRASSHSSGGSYPLLFDAFNFNPSALPTFPTPVGIEGYYADKKVNFAVIKGIENLGFGASSKNSIATFFSGVENYKVALKSTNSTYKSSSLNQYINLGSALNIFKIPDIASLPLGLSYRYSPETKKWSFNPGFEIRTSVLTVGASYSIDKPKLYYDGFNDVAEVQEVISLNANLKFSSLLLGYSLITQQNKISHYQHATQVLSFSESPTVKTQIYSGTLVTSDFSFTAAFRQQSGSQPQSTYVSSYKQSHTLVGAAYKTEYLELGAFYNYVLSKDVSLLVKIFF